MPHLRPPSIDMFWLKIQNRNPRIGAEQATDGPENYYFLIQRSEEIQDSKAREIVQAYLQRNAFFAHEENVLLAIIDSPLQDRPHTRSLMLFHLRAPSQEKTASYRSDTRGKQRSLNRTNVTHVAFIAIHNEKTSHFSYHCPNITRQRAALCVCARENLWCILQ